MDYIISCCGNYPNPDSLTEEQLRTFVKKNLTNLRAVYYCKDGEPVGLPIMFLRDDGMESQAEELVDNANRQNLIA